MQDPTLFWNAVALDAIKNDHTAPLEGENQRGPTMSSRAACLVHLAMHDAFFGVNGATTIPGLTAAGLYLTSPPVFAGANSDETRSAAVSGAAVSVLTTLYSKQRKFLEEKAAELAGENGTSDDAYAYGRRIAKDILATRKSDADLGKDEDYATSPGRFRHREDPYDAAQMCAGAAYGEANTFAVTAWQLMQGPPTGAAYLADLNEVIKKGGVPGANATTRTADESMAAHFWAYDGPMKIGTPPRLYNQILRTLANTMNHTKEQNARLFALVNCAMGDSGIHAWHYKYCYDLWRPVVGIREHDPSTGPSAVGEVKIDSPADPYWSPLGSPRTNQAPATRFTPAFPSYPSGHATFGAAAFEIMRLFYRDQKTLSFTDFQEDTIGFDFVSDEQDGKSMDSDGSVRTRHKRHFNSLAAAMLENSVSRIFLGVHWRFDGTSGKTLTQMLNPGNTIGGVPLGRAIAQNIFNNGMKQQTTPPTAPKKSCL